MMLKSHPYSSSNNKNGSFVILFVLGEIFDPKCFDTRLQLI